MNLKALFSLWTILIGYHAMYGQSGAYWYFNIDGNNLALRGYDPVSYFENKPLEGKPELTFEYQSIRYRFSSKKNLSAFKKDVERYLPQLGGWCAYRLAQKPEIEGWAQSRIPAHPEEFKIIDGKLYLFSKAGTASMLEKWNTADQEEMLIRANAFWESRKELAALADRRPPGLNPNARMENLLWERFIGKWKGEGHQLIDTVELSYSDFPEATWTFYYGYSGYCIQDDWKNTVDIGGTWNGPAIRGYDPLSNSWHMTFIPINAGRGATWLMTGRFNDQLEMEGSFESTDWQGRPFIQRIFFYNISENHFSWKADRSYNGGKTWIERFTYTECERVE